MLTILIFCLYCVVTNSEDNCDINYNTCAEESLSVYSKDSNSYFKLIDEALAKFVPCSQDNCECYSPVVDADLQPFEDGITSNMIQSMEGKGTKYQVINHKLYRQKDCLFPSRCAGIEHFIKPLLNKLPDIELVINCRDWPQINNFGKLLPVFSFSKTKDYADIMYPAWGFWEGGPAISLYPTGIGRWDNHRKSISKASENLPWQKKLNKAFFRGSRTSDERDSLILLSRKKHDLVDAQYTKNQAWKSPQDTLNAEPAKEVSFENHCKYKFLFNFRGVAASFRFKHLFLCKSLVFHVGDEWQEFFYNALKPWVHYVPIKSYPSEEELESIIVFFKKHDKLAQEIAERGYWFIWNHLRMDDLNCYWENLLLKYSNLIKHKVNLDKNLIMIN